MRLLLMVLLTTWLPATANAGLWTNGNQDVKNVIWRPDYKGFYTDSSQYHDPNPSKCGDTTGLYLIDTSIGEKEIDRLYSMMLTAFASGKKVTVFVEGCASTYVKFSGLQINQ